MPRSSSGTRNVARSLATQMSESIAISRPPAWQMPLTAAMSDANRRVLPHVLVQREAVGGEDDDGRSVLEPTYFLAFPERRVAGDDIGPAVLAAEHNVDEVQADAGDKHSRNRDQRND